MRDSSPSQSTAPERSDGPAPAAPSTAAEEPDLAEQHMALLLHELRAGRLRTRAEPEPTDPPENPLPRAVGRYLVLGTIGAGATGTVYEAFDEPLGRTVALKVFRSHVVRAGDEHAIREARALARLSHPNVVHVYEVGEAEGHWFIAMELVSGQSLRRWQREDRSWREIVRVYGQLGAGLAAAHREGLVHRDFKPDNCAIDAHGRPRVLDFGLVRDEGTSAELPSGGPPSTEPGPSGTRTGDLRGTVPYMSPEQLQGRASDARSDQFGFCVSLFEALYGQRPFEGATLDERIAAMSGPLPRSPPRGHGPPRLHRALCRGLAPDPDQRWPSMEALLAELQRIARPVPPRGVLVGAAGGLALLGFVAGRGVDADSTPACPDATAQLQEAWGDDRQRAVEAAIRDSSLSYGQETWSRVRTRLDDYALAWASRHQDACEAARVRHEQTEADLALRTGCLQRSRAALTEATAVLAEGDPARIQHAVELVAGLPALDRCDDLEALRREPPTPEAASTAQQVEALRQRLASARSRAIAGDSRGALAALERAFPEIETLGYPPLRAEALRLRGGVSMDADELEPARRDLEQAYLLAAEQRYADEEALALGQLAVLVGTRQAEHDRGTWLGRMALATSERAHGNPSVRARATADLGAVLHARGDLDESLALYRRARDLWAELGGPDHPEVARCEGSIGSVLHGQGEMAEALEHHRRSVAITERALGSHHPRVATALESLGTLLISMDELDEALPVLERALQISTAARGSAHTDVAAAHHSLGVLHKNRGELDAAAEQYARALTIWEETLGPDHPQVATTHHNLGVLAVRQGRLDDALDHHQRALEIRLRAFGPQHAQVGLSLASLDRLHFERGDLDAALDHNARAQAVVEATLGAEHPLMSALLHNAARIHLERGALDEALALAHRAIELGERAKGAEHADLAGLHVIVGMAHHRRGELDRARESLERALSITERARGPQHPDLAYPLVHLSDLAHEQGQPELSRRHAERALAVREAAGAAPKLVEQARFTLARALWMEPDGRARGHALAEQARDAFSALGPVGAEDLAAAEAWLAAHPEP